MSGERLLDWRSLLRDPSLFDTLVGQNEYLDEFVRVHKTINWPKHLDERPALVQRFSWALPSDDALDAIARYAPIVEMGAGGGYWAHLMRQRGIDVLAYDRERPHDDNYFARHLWTRIDPGTPRVLAAHADRSLFLCWPPNKSPMATNCLKALGRHAPDPRRRVAPVDRQPRLSRPRRGGLRTGGEGLAPPVGGHVRHAYRVEAEQRFGWQPA